MRAKSSFVLVTWMLVACGRTHHDGSPSSSGNDAGGTAGSSPGASGSSATGNGGAGGAVEPDSCLYPTHGLELGPRGDIGLQTFKLSAPFPIEVAPASWSDLAASYDVNGDQVSDLLYLDESATPPRFRLALSNLPPDVFDLRGSDCPELESLPNGRLLLRDLNDDGAPDFIVGTPLGVQAFVNQPQGLMRVLDFTFPMPTARASLLDAGLGDLDGDGLKDLVIGFDRLESEQGPSFELGVIQFLQQPNGRFSQGAGNSTSFANGQSSKPFFSGYLAVGNFEGPQQASALLVGSSFSSSRYDFGFLTHFDGNAPPEIEVPDLTDDIQHAFALSQPDGHDDVLAVGYRGFWLVDLSVQPARVVVTGELAFEGGPSHEAGGGPEAPRYFVFDIDRDGDLDFLERAGAANQFALHLNLDDAGFAEAQVWELDVRSGAETPFIHVGPGGGVIGRPQRTPADLAVYTLMVSPK